MSPATFAAMEVRERLLHAALRVFEEAGSRGATTRRIAAEAGVNEITLFRHFGSKSALISEALAVATREPVHTGLPAEPRDPHAELLAWSRAGYAHLRRNAAMIRTTLGELAESPGAARCVAENPIAVQTELLAYLRRLRERGMADPAMDADAAANLLMGSLFADAVGRDVVPEKYPYPGEGAPERYVTLFLRAIGAVPAAAEGPEAADAAPAGGSPEA